MPPAARRNDQHMCPAFMGPFPHIGGPILPPCASTVLLCFEPAARVGDDAVCMCMMDTIMLGAGTVLINFKPAARLGDCTLHGGLIVEGCPTVFIGDSRQGGSFRGAAASAAPLVAVCPPATPGGDTTV